MFSESAIYQYILNAECGGSYGCADDLFEQWSSDDGWWLMLLAASSGDLLYGEDSGGPGVFQFFGKGMNELSSLIAWGGKGPAIRLSDLYKGEYHFGVAPFDSHSMGWEALQFHDTGFIESKGSFYNLPDNIKILGSQNPLRLRDKLMKEAEDTLRDSVINGMSVICGPFSSICGEGISFASEYFGPPPLEQDDLLLVTEHWRFHFKPDESTKFFVQGPRGRIAYGGWYAPPFILPRGK